MLTVVADAPGKSTNAGRIVDHAVAYAKAGLSVLPLHARGKTPATRHPGKDDATTDTMRISSWWARHPDHNIGVRPPRGTVVLDVDPRNSGDAALAELVSRHDRLPETWTCCTGSGGVISGCALRGRSGGGCVTGMDLKSNAGYLVVPPSIHPNGQPYRWANALPVAHAPAWLRPMPTPPPAPTRSTPSSPGGRDGLVDFVATAAEGNRNGGPVLGCLRAAAEGTLPAMTAQLVAAAVNNGLPEPGSAGHHPLRRGTTTPHD